VSWTINLANLGRHAQLTRCFSAVAELLARSSATAEKQRVSCACLPRLANWLCNALNNADVHYWTLPRPAHCTYCPTTASKEVHISSLYPSSQWQSPHRRPVTGWLAALSSHQQRHETQHRYYMILWDYIFDPLNVTL